MSPNESGAVLALCSGDEICTTLAPSVLSTSPTCQSSVWHHPCQEQDGHPTGLAAAAEAVGLSQEPFAPAEVTFLLAVALFRGGVCFGTEHHTLLGSECEGNGAKPGLKAGIPIKGEDIQLENGFSRQREQGDGQGAEVGGVSAPESWGWGCLCKP